MKSRVKRIFPSCVLLFLIFTLIFLFGCISITPAHSVEVQNNSDKTVVILSQAFIDREWGEIRNWGQVAPGERRAVFSLVEPGPSAEDEKTLVEARDLNGKLIKSWVFPFQDRILLVIDANDIPKP